MIPPATKEEEPRIVIRHNETDEVLVDLPGRSLRDIDLRGKDLRKAAMYAAELKDFIVKKAVSSIHLRKASLSGARLAKADLSEAVFSGEEVVGVDFRGADLTRATVVRTHFIYCNFQGAVLNGLRMMNTAFSGCPSLSRAKGLEAVEHLGPSVLDLITLRATIGDLPDAFLLGVGYTAPEVTELRRLYVAKRFYSCFISYACQDSAFAEHFRKRLIKSGISC